MYCSLLLLLNEDLYKYLGLRKITIEGGKKVQLRMKSGASGFDQEKNL
jgi:hypothetical protein